MANFNRKLRLLEYFHDREEDEDDSLVKNKSDFVPPKHRNAALEKFISNMENTPTKSRNPSYKENISKHQRAAIKRLSEDNSIVLKEADKGGSVVIMDKDHYKGMSFDILQNNEYYEPLDQVPQRLNKIA